MDGTQILGSFRGFQGQLPLGFPACWRTATASFWLKINTTETTTSAKNDTLVVPLGPSTIGSGSNLQHRRYRSYRSYVHVIVRVTLPLDNYKTWTGATLLFAGGEVPVIVQNGEPMRDRAAARKRPGSACCGEAGPATNASIAVRETNACKRGGDTSWRSYG